MMHRLALLCTLLAAGGVAAGQASVQVEPSHLQGPRPLAQQTESAVIHDYVQAWESLSAAADQNRPDLLDGDFVGIAQTKLAAAVSQEAKLGLRTRYQVRSHDIKIIFYSPEGLSIQLVDNIEYDEQLLDHGKVVAVQPVHARYVAVLTPTDVRWKVRVLQSEPL